MKRKLTKLLTIVISSMLIASTLFTVAFADSPAPAGTSGDVAWIGTTGYPTLEKAVTAANNGDTIMLGEGKYTLYKKGAATNGKNLTFVGKGVGKTEWGIGATQPDPDKFGTEYNGDYSFDGAGTITFKNMTLQSGKVDYLGFIRADKTVVEDCAVNGKTFYWGYSSAEFRNTTFNCPAGDYALWTYSSPIMTFDGCTFNSSGKTINVYTDFGAGKHDITVNFKNCTVNNSWIKNDKLKESKPVLNINDSNMGGYKYIINISGNNRINNTSAANDIFRDPVTCSRWFGFGGKAGTNNTGRSVVTIDGDTAFKDGKMCSHELNSNYTDGYKDNAYDVTIGDWVLKDDGTYTRNIKKVCKYCGYEVKDTQAGYSVTYTDGVENKEIFEDQSAIVPKDETTPAFNGETPSRDGYSFKGWDPKVEKTVTKNVTYTAVWEKNASAASTSDATGNTNDPKTGDTSNSILWLALLLMSGITATGIVTVRRNAK
ncbi:MAG: hypothetical protein ACLVC5_04530 [Clostridia bacterium]